MISYLISFPLTMGEGWDGGGHRGSSPPHLNPPPPWGEEVIFFDSIGVILFYINIIFKILKTWKLIEVLDTLIGSLTNAKEIKKSRAFSDPAFAP
jgi:hypothetical protein